MLFAYTFGILVITKIINIILTILNNFIFANMNLILDIISPIPEFSIFEDNKIILSKKIINSPEEKLSDKIIPSFEKIDESLNLTEKLKSLIVTSGPGSYTALRVGISFMLGLHFSKNIKIASISIADLLKFEINNDLNYGFYVVSSNNQEFICIKMLKKDYFYIKLEDNNKEQFKEIQDIDILYFNHRVWASNNNNFKQINYLIKQNIVKNINKIDFNDVATVKALYVSNNKSLN